ncbi:DUF1059 domain-containing protein [Haloarchaeobius amylolyticus]|uniref:DUF1059 domain-containing protein n=1 Tax=Haloarchaeobius amylolyticus TaxID=1198296 RepID=A0ABD6BJC2_9EURY
MPYQFECLTGSCQFMIRSSSADEVERLVRAHARMTHNSRLTVADIKRCTERVEVA